MSLPRKWRTGRITKVPCPWEDCGRLNDFSDSKELLTDQWSRMGTNDNPWFECDHCGKMIEVVKVEPTTLVSVRASSKPRNPNMY